LVASILQKSASFTKFGKKENFLSALNPKIEEWQNKIRKFVENLVEISNNPPPRVRPPIFVERDLASLHKFLKKNHQKISSMAKPEEVKENCFISFLMNFKQNHLILKMEGIMENLEYVHDTL
jgi:hypothetical protein